MSSQLRKAIMKRSQIKSKANKSSKPFILFIRHGDKTAYITPRNLVLKLNKEAKKSFLKNQITENATNKRKTFGKYANLFSVKRVFIIYRNLLLKLKEV